MVVLVLYLYKDHTGPKKKNDKMTLTASLVYASQQSYISTSRVTRWSKTWYVMSYKNRKLSSIVNSLRNLSSETDSEVVP